MAAGFLDHSDHKIVDFKIFGVMRKKFGTVATLDFKRVNVKLLSKLISNVPWEFSLEGLGVHESWSLFKNCILKVLTSRRMELKLSEYTAYMPFIASLCIYSQHICYSLQIGLNLHKL